jgi:hypothetical protein
MQKINLYRYEEKNGAIRITPTPANENDSPSRLRLVAEEDMVLTDGIVNTPVIDIFFEEEDNWWEIINSTEKEIL